MPNSLKCKIKHLCHNGTITEHDRDRILKALEQESCEDCISRKDAINAMSNALERVFLEHRAIAERTMNKLPPVTPQQKIGRWIDENKDTLDAKYGRHLYICQKCNKYADYFVCGTEDWWDTEKPNYCPNCGQPKMQEVEEWPI